MLNIFFIFIHIIKSETSADLTVPFQIDSENKVGFWEFGGSAIVDQENILLCPPVQYNKGYAWTNVEIPTGSWSVAYKMKVSSGTGGGGFGLWFIDQYGDSGQIHGGPSKFKGIAILGTVRTDKSEEIDIHIVQNLGKDNYNLQNLTKPDKTVNFDPQKTFLITLEFINQKLTVFYSINENKKGDVIATADIKTSLSDNYIGITAQSDAYTSRFDLKSVTFQLGIEKSDNAHSGSTSKPRDATLGKNAPSGHYNPDTKEPLRNPVLQLTLQEYKTLEQISNPLEVSSESNAEKVLKIIEEMNHASYDVASFKELNAFITNQLMPYSQKWHKRTLKIVEHVQQARNIMGAAWNYTHLLINNMNSTMRMNSVKTTFKVIDLAELLTSEADIAFENSGDLTKSSFLVKSLVNFAIVEIVVLVVFFVLVQNEKFRAKIFRDNF